MFSIGEGWEMKLIIVLNNSWIYTRDYTIRLVRQHIFMTRLQTNQVKTNFGPKFDWTPNLYLDDLSVSDR